MKKIPSFSSFPYIHLFFGVAVGLAVYQIVLGRVNPDEVEGLHTAWKMFNGKRIYVDFFQHHHPLFYYLLVPLIAIAGETLLTFWLAELLAAVLFAGIVVTTYMLCEKIYGDRKTSLLSVVLLLVFPWFILRGTHIRPDILQVLLGLLSFRYLVRWLDAGTRRHLLLSALLLSLSFLALQKAVFLIFAVGLVLLLQLFRTDDARMTMRDFLLYWALFSLLPVLWVLWLLMTGELRNYIDFNWLINMKWLGSFSVYDAIGRNMGRLLGLTGLALLFIAGCFVRSPGNADAHRAALLAGLCLAASMFLQKVPDPRSFLMGMPFVSIVIAVSLRHFFPKAITGLIALLLTVACANQLIKDTKDGSLRGEAISTMRHVLEVSGPEDVYFGHMEWNLFRRDADFFWFCFAPKTCLDTLQSFREYDWDPVRIIGQTRPKVIGVAGGDSWTEHIWGEWYAPIMEHPTVAPHYERSPGNRWLYTRKEASSQ